MLIIKFQKTDKDEIEKEIEMLKMIIDFHSREQVIKNQSERNEYMDAILDRLSELIKKRDKQE